jgi:trans-aconitate 2-methyltransferase
MVADQWAPEQYNKFRAERMQPFFDLIALVQPRAAMRVIDLGCGTGEQSALIAERLPGAIVEGIDSSAAMLEQAAPRASRRVSFRQEDISRIEDFSAYDLVISNAALQWVPGNEAIMARMLARIAPGAQVAIQAPRNEDHPSHRIAEELAHEAPFRELLQGFVRQSAVLPLERYAALLYEFGLHEQLCIEKIYGHVLPSTDAVVEWVKGTSLGAYLARLDTAGQEQFLAAYRERLLAEVGDHRPYFYPFRRLLFWGRKGDQPRP